MDPLDLIVATAREAGDLLLRMADGALDVREKSPRDLVTAADRAAEEHIVARLREAYPDAEILGEEGGTRAGSSEADLRFVVDPLDGTTNYAHGYPFFCVSIACERAGELVAGAIVAPALGEVYVAERGAGATRNGVRIAVSATAELAEAFLCTGFLPADYDRNGAAFAHLSRRARAVRRDGSAALDLAFVAAGRFDGFWEYDLHAWDVAAGTLLVREAGGCVTGIAGEPEALHGAGAILATNGRCASALAEALARSAEAARESGADARGTSTREPR